MPEAKPAAGGSDDNKLIGALCYVPVFLISILVPLYILLTDKKQDKTLAFHAWQSLLLTVVLMVVFFGLAIVQIGLTIVSGGLGAILSCLYLPFGLVVLLGMLFVAYKTYQGEKMVLPIVGGFAEKQAGK